MKKIFLFLCTVPILAWGLTALAENVTSGTGAGARITTGDANVFLGESAGAYTTTGVGNIFVGYSTGNRNTTGSRNIYLGYLSGMGLTGSDRFVLRNYPYNTVLYAHMDSQLVAINATNALGYNLYVSGTAKITGATTYSTVTADSITSGRFLSSLTGGANNAAISPSGDKDTGLYWLTATGNRIGFTAKGTQVALLDSVGFGIITGTAAAPSFHNLNDRDTGLYWLTATGNRLGVATKGVSHVIVDSTGVAIRGKVEIRENVIPLTDSLLVLRDSLGNTKAWVDSLGKVHADTLHATNIVATGYGITNGAGIVRGGLTVTGITATDTLHATNSVDTGYHITDGVGIVRGGLTVTGIATADTVHATNAVDTGYHITNGASIVRGGETVTGIAASDTVHTTNLAATGYGILNGAGIFRSGTTTTGSASADTTKGTNAAFTGYGIVNGATILRGTVNTGRIATREATPPASDSLQTWCSSLGNTVASIDSLGNMILGAGTALSGNLSVHVGTTHDLAIRLGTTGDGTAALINAGNKAASGNVPLAFNGSAIKIQFSGLGKTTIGGSAEPTGILTIKPLVAGLGDSLLVLRSSNGNTVAWVDSLGKVHADTLHATNHVATGYSITNGAGIVRGGLTTTGSASADTTKGTNAAFTGYGIVNGATILRGTATVAGTLTPQALNSPVQVILADSTLTAARSGYTYIARPIAAKATLTLPENPAIGTNFIALVADADSLRFTTTGSDSLIDNTGAAWKTTSSVAGSVKVILGVAAKWFMIPYVGTWTSY